MRLRALPLRTGDAPAGGGLIPRMRAWIGVLVAAPTGPAPVGVAGAGAGPICIRERMAGRPQAPAAQGAVMAKDGTDEEGGEVVAFLRADRTPLVELANDLRQRLATVGIADDEPLLLRVEGGAAPRLWIDRSAYVEYRGPLAGYRVVLEDAFETRITMETRDFDSAADFVRHYIVARLAEPQAEGDR